MAALTSDRPIGVTRRSVRIAMNFVFDVPVLNFCFYPGFLSLPLAQPPGVDERSFDWIRWIGAAHRTSPHPSDHGVLGPAGSEDFGKQMSDTPFCFVAQPFSVRPNVGG